MLIIREITGNAWGCIFIFVFLWNAFWVLWEFRLNL
jgi:hypothetical protein